MVSKSKIVAPEDTAVRTALWRALHVKLDPKPHILVDEIGAQLVAENNWLNRADMNPIFSKGMRAAIVARARFIEDLLEEKIKQGTLQYVILGAGLDTFAQRRPALASHLQIFEVDQPEPQAWKQKRLSEIGFEIPNWLHFVPANFEADQSWWKHLIAAGFDKTKPSIVVSTGVSMYLSREANSATFQQLATLPAGSTFATTFMLALELMEPQERAVMEFVMKKAQESGTPFLSLFTPGEIQAIAKDAGFKKSQNISGRDLYQRYFVHRSDGLNAGNAEAFLVATN